MKLKALMAVIVVIGLAGLGMAQQTEAAATTQAAVSAQAPAATQELTPAKDPLSAQDPSPAQDPPPEPQAGPAPLNPTPVELSGVPILTGYSSFTANFEPGKQVLGPTIAPIILIPIGKRWLIEAEGEFEGEYEHMTGEPWEHAWGKGVEYLQADLFINRHLTLVAGRSLTPFGIFNERLHPSWIKNLQTAPLIMPIGTGSGNGAQLRGGLSLSPKVNFNYAAYFSAASTVRAFEAERVAGTRMSLFFPDQRLEIGGSYQRNLQDEHFNTWGMDFTWQAKPIPLDIHAEYAHSPEMGNGYWIEAAYRTRQWRGKFFRRSQAVLRMEQYFTPAMGMGGGGGGHGEELPDVNTQRFMFGWNYYFNDALKLSTAYGRNFSSDGDRNIWSIGLSYRWFFGLGGKQK